jgi:hypothetical protein
MNNSNEYNSNAINKIVKIIGLVIIKDLISIVKIIVKVNDIKKLSFVTKFISLNIRKTINAKQVIININKPTSPKLSYVVQNKILESHCCIINSIFECIVNGSI